ncbi:MAG: sugar phosphate isomerase/epimerase [Treponema sp.]|nr:sugar phosphate isomerase/epimerase [Treponema sp.]
MKSCMFAGLFRNSDFRTAVEGAAKAGYEGIEVRFAKPHMDFDTPADQLKVYSRMIADSGLFPASLYTFTGNYSVRSDREIDEVEFPNAKRVFEAACVLGTPLVKITVGGPSPHRAQNYHFEKAAFWHRRTAELAKTFGLKVVYEIHAGALCETVDSSMRFMNMVDCGNAGFIHDPGNMYIAGDHYGRFAVDRFGAKIMHLHIKDIKKIKDADGKDKWVHAPLNTGEVNHQEVFQALKDIGFTGYLSTEVNIDGMDPMQAAVHEYKEIRRMIDACN